MSSAHALQLLRSCTPSLPYRALARPSRLHRAWVVRGARPYSDDKGASFDAAKEGEQETQKDGADALDSEATPDSPLAKAQAEAADLMGRLRYLQADFLNLQRNSAREREKTRDFAITNFALDLLETVDVLSLALKSVPPSALSSPGPTESDPPPSDSVESTPEAADDPPPPPPLPPTKTTDDYLRELYTGVEMTQRQLLQTLFKYHVKPFDPTGDQFDPNRHEALYQAPLPEKTPGTIIDCQKIGYTIRDRVLRAAQVGVAQETHS
ncbi:GrpE-domain-containing protein [Mycena sp. CBHHK59/15]|nr:GrpE-domain-containing protein [Mycena sp. CBHHK59/15]